ncbi:MAG: hypothetical protein LC749_07070, partial [Actinobacteria bacterium]|nr:hypothetical protein [Actinomycetota bacterium]
MDPNVPGSGISSFYPTSHTAGSSNPPRNITLGPDGNMWFTTYQGKVDRISPYDGRITEYSVIDAASVVRDVAGAPLSFGYLSSSTPPIEGITSAPDGSLWFTVPSAHRVGRITPPQGITPSAPGVPPVDNPAPDIKLYSVGAQPYGIASGPDGKGGSAIWYTDIGSNSIGRLNPTAANPAASVTASSLDDGPADGPPALPLAITAGPDGWMWFTESGHNRLGKIDPATNHLSYYPAVPSYGSAPLGIAADLSGKSDSLGRKSVWFAESGDPKLGRIELGDGPLPPVSTCGMPPGTLPPVITDPNTPGCDLQTSGPLTHIVISPSLNCQVYATGTAGQEKNSGYNGGYQFYTDGYDDKYGASRLAECGTFLAMGGVLYGPDIYPCFEPPANNPGGCGMPSPTSASRFTGFIPVSQKGVTGKGTRTDPFTIVTVVCAGTAADARCDGTGVDGDASQVRITQTDAYVVGQPLYSTSVEFKNMSKAPIGTAEVY